MVSHRGKEGRYINYFNKVMKEVFVKPV